ncbi:GTP-binding protein [soil metagenome]
MKADPIPVWLLTGFLGSGKTTLLASWLQHAALADTALIVNEIGEVGLDDRLLGNAVDSGSLIANACVCCTGLPGLEEALTELWWDRLHRRRPSYGSVMIETTGIADPRPIIEALGNEPFLKQRYELAGVITTVSADAGRTMLATQAEAVAQVEAADVIVITRIDKVDGAELELEVRRLNPDAAIGRSANASIGWDALIEMMSASGRRVAPGHPHVSAATGHHDHEHAEGHHHHELAATFTPLPDPLSIDALLARADSLRRGALRVKGIVRLQDGSLQSVQWSPGDETVSMVRYLGEPATLGLTRIARDAHPAHH